MSHKGRQGRMSESSGAAVSGAVILEEPEGSGATGGRGEVQAQDQGPFRCAVWPRQQTWLCVVPLLIGFIGLGLSLMLLKWIVVGTVRDYVPTDLVDANRIGQDPIFLSKPSGIPKGPDTTTTTTTPAVDGGNPTPRTVTVAKGRTRTVASTTTINPRGGGASGSQVTPRNPGNRNGHIPSIFTTTTAAPRTTFVIGAATASSSPANPTVLRDSTQMWTTEHTTTEEASTTLTTHTHSQRKTPSPTVPPLHSEHFKPCHEKDLAYCLNGGECFVIETLSGPHKHCKCREGYQGIRCDQFLPKTDSILSDPIDHLGIEFMESKAVYKRQVLSITSIAMAISLLGTMCMALYCRNKRRREKLQAHLKESRSLKSYTTNPINLLEAKMKVPNTNLQMHEYCKRSPTSRQGSVCESSFVSAPPPSGSRGAARHHRSSPEQRTRSAHWSTSRRTPPIARGRLNPIGGSKFSGPAYEHLQEVDPSEKETEAQKRVHSQEESSGCDTKQDAFVHMQTPVSMETQSSALPWCGSAQVRSPPQSSRSLRRPGRRRHSLSPSPPPFRSCSIPIPIIPSVQGHHDNEVSCMQTSPETTEMSTICEEERRDKAARARPSSSSSYLCSSAVGRRQEAAALLLEEAQEQLRVLALAHRKQEEVGSGSAAATSAEPRETVCFLNLSGGSAAGLGCGGPTQTQLLSHRDPVQ
ncbi:pro-neuregulin-3, membrane-bound isoform isoform X1 [Xiphophorus hellerii]|uniref:pro-neuregulin-3, membrane-bound isoform isoform X1 n=1 Tax=Xiphophorus hellerii TaxID=8084 RepID=UPI0013B39639|nr:pro-neuregulin-3, membrane-bound isoform-like isoform X1 [Xiphophorus hellerii]XP_032408936.1 pro-neuregulin-3, membrane-bound isoform-like isoform X1 [Xiphophorus hellerii]